LIVAFDAPFGLLIQWLKAAEQTEPRVPDAMQLATVGADGRPQVRTVLLKDSGPQQGLIFYTNYASRKAGALDATKTAAICLHWKDLARQVIVDGHIERTDDPTSDAYFATRSRGSQLAAWASRQSAPLVDLDEIAGRMKKYQERFADGPVPRPPFWGGYRLIPDRFEFWQSRADRLHHRSLYVRSGDGWATSTLYP
jgi:pyridoxamine 5'-phosphate oxidase